jgi:hypothetical protein
MSQAPQRGNAEAAITMSPPASRYFTASLTEATPPDAERHIDPARQQQRRAHLVGLGESEPVHQHEPQMRIRSATDMV